jgi:benzoyl-CoA 2,3-dioxygenase component A
MDCVSPCPTGSINHFVAVAKPYSLEDQFSWTDLPDEMIPANEAETAPPGAVESLDDEIAALLDDAHKGAGGRMKAPLSASKPRINLFGRKSPAEATVAGNFRLTAEGASSDIRHIILDLGATSFPVLEGQSIGIVLPGTDANGRPHKMRLFSVSSPRDGERPNTNNLALTVKRVVEPHPDGSIFRGLASNYVCDLKQGDKIQVAGPFGSTFLMPDDSDADIVMICTGTGSAPMRAMTEWRRRLRASGKFEGGKLMLFFGARTPQELPYFGPLQNLPKDFIDINFAFSREPGKPKHYVQDVMRERAADLARLLPDPDTFFYVCGLKAMEEGVVLALRDVAQQAGLNWDTVGAALKREGRLHLETY